MLTKARNLTYPEADECRPHPRMLLL